MYLVFENTKKSYQFPANNELLVGNDADCDIQINHPKVLGRHFSVVNKPYGCVLHIFNDSVTLNGMPVSEQCLLDTGDLLCIDDLGFRLLDDQYIPKNSTLNHTNISLNQPKNTTSVYGLRSYADESMGAFIIDSYHHHDGWHVIRDQNQLHLIDNKNVTLLNGMKIAQAELSNGDIIANEQYKYKVELPGTSGFSKFSPSHPRNVQLSEAVSKPHSDKKASNTAGQSPFIKNNLWWMTLMVGLIVLILIIINNQPG